MSFEYLPVSVVIPCFNCSSTIERAVDSVMMQTKLPYEVIVVDDKSSDDTLHKLKELKIKYTNLLRFNIISLDVNSGPGTARNKGWDCSSQEFIAFLDSDDTWHERKLEIQYGIMKDNPNTYLSCHKSALNANEPIENKIEGDNHHVIELSKMRMFISNEICTRSVMVVNEKAYRFEERKKYSEDFLLWMEIIINGNKVLKINEVLAYSYKKPFGEGGLTGNLWRMQLGQFEAYDILKDKGLISSTFKFIIKGYAFLRYIRRVFIHKIWS